MTNKQQKFEQFERLFEALANPLRLKLYLQILQDGCDCSFEDNDLMEATCVKGLMASLDMPQSTVSTYLRDLEQGGLIECRRQGRNLFCRPRRDTLIDLKIFIESAVKQIRYRA